MSSKERGWLRSGRGFGRRSVALLLAATLASFASSTFKSASATGATVYSNDFTASVGSEWSSNAISLATPLGERVLGVGSQNVCYGGVCDWPAGSHTLTLTLTGLPEHSSMVLDFEFYTLRSWDGNDPTWGQDQWDLDATGVASDIQPLTNFSNYNPPGEKTQSFPDAYPAAHPGMTGAAATGDLLGYGSSGNSETAAARYDLNYVFDHSADDVTFRFTGYGIQGWGDEGWVLDDITVTVNPIDVTTTADDLTDNGNCTVREAIAAANTDTAVDACPAGSGADTISLPAGTYALGIAGAGEDANATGDLDITSSLTIAGAGAGSTTIDGSSLDRVFHVLGGPVNISGVRVTGGSVTAENGGGILIASGQTLSLDRTIVTSNSVSLGTARDVDGGGIFVGGGATLTLRDGTVSNNEVACSDSYCGGGGIGNAYMVPAWSGGGTVVIERSAVTGNTVGNHGASHLGSGAGIANGESGSLTMTDSTVSGNQMGAAGGGIGNAGDLSLQRVTISGNSGHSPGFMSGGGIYDQASAGKTLSLSNVTLSGNFAASGAIQGANLYKTGSDEFSFVSSTIENGSVEANSGTVSFKGTVIAGGCTGTSTPVTHGNNIDAGTSCGLDDGVDGDQANTDPMLGTLIDNGGPTLTHALLAGSPAIDGNLACPPPATDQRGVTRDQGPACDIGAFETTPPAPSIAFAVSGELYNAASFAAGCADATPDLCGQAFANPDGAALDRVTVRIQRASDDMYWNGVTWQLDEAWSVATGTSSWTYEFSPGDDTYTLSARATDEDGYAASTPSVTFTVDLTAPETTIDSGPQGTVYVSDATFSFTSSEPDSTFECRLDGPDFSDCDSPQTYEDLGLGTHIFEVRATDEAGNADAEAAQRSWTIAAPKPKKVVLKASRTAVEGGRRVRLTAIVSPCAGHERDLVVFQKKAGGLWRTITRKNTDDLCKAWIRVRMMRTTVFRAVSPKQDADHLKGISNQVQIQVRR